MAVCRTTQVWGNTSSYWGYTWHMPTTLPRTWVSHTPPVEHALDAARRRWPGEKPSTLLVNLVIEGGHKVEEEMGVDLERRLAKAEAVSGSLPNAWGPGYLDEIRDGWPG